MPLIGPGLGHRHGPRNRATRRHEHAWPRMLITVAMVAS
jgi:hypothetical protein